MDKNQFTLNITEEYKKADANNTKEDNLVLLDKIISELTIIKETKENDEMLDENISNFESLRADLWGDVFDDMLEFNIDFDYYFDILKDWSYMQGISFDKNFIEKPLIEICPTCKKDLDCTLYLVCPFCKNKIQ